MPLGSGIFCRKSIAAFSLQLLLVVAQRRLGGGLDLMFPIILPCVWLGSKFQRSTPSIFVLVAFAERSDAGSRHLEVRIDDL